MEAINPTTYRTLNVFISNHSHNLVEERAAAQRVLMTFGAGRYTEILQEGNVFVGLFGIHADVETLTELEQARQQDKICLLFMKDVPASHRDPQLNDFLYTKTSSYEVQAYRSIPDLTYRLLHTLEQYYNRMQRTEWQVPPLPLRDLIFTGREAEIERLLSLLIDKQPTAVRGEPGIGKTALAKELAYRLSSKFPAGVFWLEHFGTEGQTIQYALRKLALAHPAGRGAVSDGHSITPAEVRGWLANIPSRGLVIADDVHQVAPLRDLRTALPGNFNLLVTTTASLSEIGWNDFELGLLSPADALRVLRRMLGAPENLAEEALQPLKQLVDLLDGHPLCLRLASEWMLRAGGWQTALVYLDRFAESPNPLARLPMDDPRNPLLETAFALSFSSLSERQKKLMLAASVFAPNAAFTGDALLHVAEEPRAAADLDVLPPGLLMLDEAADGYRLHSLISQYAYALLGRDERNDYRLRHLAYYEEQAALHDQPVPDPALDMAQLRQAFDFAQRKAQYRLVGYVLAAGQYLQLLNQDHELRRWLDVVLSIPTDHLKDMSIDRWSLPTNLRGLGDLSLRIDYHAAAQEFYDRALVLYYENKSLSGQANTLKALGDLRASQGELEEAQEFYDRTLQLYAQIDFQLGRANTLKSLGDMRLGGGELDKARDFFYRSLELYEQIEFQLGQAHTLKSLGDLHSEEHNLKAAREYYQLALSLYREINLQAQEAETLLLLGDAQVGIPDFEAAHHSYEEALYMYRQMKDDLGQAQVLMAMGNLEAEQQHFNNARFAYEAAAKLYHGSDSHMKAAEIRLQLAHIYLSLGQPESAVMIILRALKTFHQLESRTQIQEAHRYLREVARSIGSSFPLIWAKVTDNAPLPEWLKLVPSTTIPQQLIYAVRDFMLAPDLDASQRILEEYQDILLTDSADEVFARMLRQYAGQTGQTRQIDKYRELLQRCHQIGIEAAFEEARSPVAKEQDHQFLRLRQSLDAYDDALERLRDIPLVYANVQISRAITLRQLAMMPGQDKVNLLGQALEAYDDALRYQSGAPLDYAQTQIARAETLSELAALPDANQVVYLNATLAAYTDALQYQYSVPVEYAHTLLHRASTLHKLARLPGQDTVTLMQEALSAYDEALGFHQDAPQDYAQTQSQRALLLYEMAGLPGEDFQRRMVMALNAYDEALEYLRDEDPLAYARTENNRVALLRDMAGLPGEDRAARLYQALAACNEALRFLLTEPLDYAQTQINRAHLLREIAGLTGEHRLARMREALATYTETLAYLAEQPMDYAAVQNSRAALLREMSGIAGENTTRRLRESLEAAAEAMIILDKLDPNGANLGNARRMMINTAKEVIKYEGEDTLKKWWQQTVGTPIPTWLK